MGSRGGIEPWIWTTKKRKRALQQALRRRVIGCLHSLLQLRMSTLHVYTTRVCVCVFPSVLVWHGMCACVCLIWYLLLFLLSA